jgi:hypothetical protein
MTDYVFDSVQAALKAGLLSGTLDGIRYERIDRSESYTTSPPARLIIDSDGAVWGLGNEYVYKKDGYLEFNVLRNDIDTGENAEKIEYRGGIIWIYGSAGWRHFSRSRRYFI